MRLRLPLPTSALPSRPHRARITPTELSNQTCLQRKSSHIVNECRKSNPQSRWKAVPQYQNQLRDTGDNTSVSVRYGEDTMYLYTHYFETDPATPTACNGFPPLLLSTSTSPNTSFFGPAAA